MTHKNLLKTGIATAFCAMALLIAPSCNQATQTSAPIVANEKGEAVALPYAYIRIDSVMSAYTYAQEVQQKLATDAKASETRLQGRAAALQQAAENFERKAKINAFVSQEQAQAEQAKVLKMQQDVAALQQELAQQLGQKQALMQEDLLKEIESQLKVFNGGRFKMIFSNAGVLYADEALDLTKDFIKHLNDSYKPNSQVAEAKADSTKSTN